MGFPVAGAFGAHPLFVRGDVVLWAPYLLTGVFEAVVGWMIIAGHWDAKT